METSLPSLTVTTANYTSRMFTLNSMTYVMVKNVIRTITAKPRIAIRLLNKAVSIDQVCAAHRSKMTIIGLGSG